MGLLFLEGWHTSPAYGIALILSFYLTMIFYLIGIILLFSSARKLGPRVTRIAASISVIGLTAFAFYEFWLGAGYFIKG
jgi:ABC-type dipeptide/oligopeptide/nickel transport system permease component